MAAVCVFDWDCTVTCKHMYKCLAGWDGFADNMDSWCRTAGAALRSCHSRRPADRADPPPPLAPSPPRWWRGSQAWRPRWRRRYPTQSPSVCRLATPPPGSAAHRRHRTTTRIRCAPYPYPYLPAMPMTTVPTRLGGQRVLLRRAGADGDGFQVLRRAPGPADHTVVRTTRRGFHDPSASTRFNVPPTPLRHRFQQTHRDLRACVLLAS